MRNSARPAKKANASRSAREELIGYGARIARAGLAAGTGGCLSAREGNIVWMKPRGLALGEIRPDDLCGLDLTAGKQVQGRNRPAPEVNMHLAIYRARPDVAAVFQAPSPWATAVINAGLKLKAMFAEFVNDLGRTGTVAHVDSTTPAFADAIGKFAKTHDTLFIVNHGVLAVGVTMKQAYFRLVVAEDAAKSLVAATVVGKPKFLTQAQCDEILSLDAVQHRTKMVEKK